MTHQCQNNLYLCALIALSVIFLNTGFTTLVVFSYLRDNSKMLFYILLIVVNFFYIVLMFSMWCDSYSSNGIDNGIDNDTFDYTYQSIENDENDENEILEPLLDRVVLDNMDNVNEFEPVVENKKKRVFSLVNYGEEYTNHPNKVKRHNSGGSDDEEDYGVIV